MGECLYFYVIYTTIHKGETPWTETAQSFSSFQSIDIRALGSDNCWVFLYESSRLLSLDFPVNPFNPSNLCDYLNLKMHSAKIEGIPPKY